MSCVIQKIRLLLRQALGLNNFSFQMNTMSEEYNEESLPWVYITYLLIKQNVAPMLINHTQQKIPIYFSCPFITFHIFVFSSCLYDF